MARKLQTVIEGTITPEQAQALYVLANTKGVEQRREALAATGLDRVPMRPLVEAGVITVTKDGQLRLRSEGRLVAADRLPPEKQEAFNAFISGSFVGEAPSRSPEERIEERSEQMAQRELARRAALAAEATKEDWVRSVIRKAKPKISDDHGVLRRKLNTLEAISLRQRAALSEDTREDFYDMYERLRVLTQLRKKYDRSKDAQKKQELKAQIDAVFELVKNPSDDDIKRERERRRRIEKARRAETPRSRAARMQRERVEREKRLSRERKKQERRRMPAHDAAMEQARELIERFKRQRERYEKGDRAKPPSSQIIKGDRGALGVLSDERDRLVRTPDEENVQRKLELVDGLTQYAMSLVGLAPAPGERLVPARETGISELRPERRIAESQKAISRPMTYRKYGKYTLVGGRPKFEISTADLRAAKEELKDALSITDSELQARKFGDMQTGRKSVKGKRLAGAIYGADPFFKLRDKHRYRQLWSELRELLERKRLQGGGSLTQAREERLKEIKDELDRMRRESIAERKRIDSRALREAAKQMYDEVTRELEDRKRILFEDHYKDVLAQQKPRIQAAKSYLDDLATRMNNLKPGLGPKLRDGFGKLQDWFLLALDAAGQSDVKSQRKHLEILLASILKDKGQVAQGLTKSKEELAEQEQRIKERDIPAGVAAQIKERLTNKVEENEKALKSLEEKEKELRKKLDLLSVDRMAKLTKHELLIAGLPEAGAQTGLTDIGAQIRDAIASGGDPMLVVDELLSQQAKPDYLREMDRFATAQIKKGKQVKTVLAKQSIEEQRLRERAQGAQRRSDLARLEEERSKLAKRLEFITDPDQRRKVQKALDQMSEQIYKLRSGEVLASGLRIDVMQQPDAERRVVFQMLKNEFKQTKRNIEQLLSGKPASYKYRDGENLVEIKGLCRVPEQELQNAKLKAARQAGIGVEVESLIASGDARNIDAAVAILQGEIKFVREFASKYQNEATKIVERFSELQAKVDAAVGTADQYTKIKSELDEVIAQIKESEKRLRRSEKGGISPEQRKQLLSNLRARKEELSEQLYNLPAPLQKTASVLVKQPELHGKERRKLAKASLSSSEYEEYKLLEPKYNEIVQRAVPSEYGLTLLKPGQKPIEEAISEERKLRYAKLRSEAGKAMAVGEYPLVEQSQLDDYRRIFARTPESERQDKYNKELVRLTRSMSRLAAYLRSYATKIEIDNVEYVLKTFKPQRVTKAIYVSRSYGDKDYDELVRLAKEQAADRATKLRDTLLSQVLFNRATRNSIRGYKALALENKDKTNFKRDLKTASALMIVGKEPTDSELAAQSRLLSRFNTVDNETFSLPRGASIANIDSRLASILARIKRAVLVMVLEGLDLDLKEILETEGQLDDYNELVRKAKIRDPQKMRAALAVLSMIDVAYEEAKARGGQIIDSKTVDNGEGEDGMQRVSVETFLSKDEDYERAVEYEERANTKGDNILTPQEAATLISAELLQDRNIKQAARRLEAQRREEQKKREEYRKTRERLGLEVGERLHALPTQFGDKKKRTFLPGALHTIIPVLKSDKDFKERYKGAKVKKKAIAFSRADGENAIREMVALAAQTYRNSPPPPSDFEFAVEVKGNKAALIAVYLPSDEVEEYLYKPAPEGWVPTGIIGMLEQKMRNYERAVKENIPFRWWDRYAEAYIKRSMTESPRAPILRRLERKDSMEAKADAALNRRANREAIELVNQAASQVPVMSEAEFDREFPAKQFERLSVPSVARPVISKVDPDRIVGYKYTPVSKDGSIVRQIAPRNVTPERSKRSMMARYYAVQLRTLFTEEVLSRPEKMKSLMYPHLDESSRVGASVQPLRQGDLQWPRLAQFAVVNSRDKSVGLYIVFPKKVAVTGDKDVPAVIKMVRSSQAITDYELMRARVAARWVADVENQSNKWAPAIRAAIERKPIKNPSPKLRTIDPSKYVFVEFEPLLGKGIKEGIVKETRVPGQVERPSGHPGLRKMLRRNLEYDFFAIPKSKVSTKYMRYNKPYELYFDGETIFINTPEETIKSLVRLSPSGVPQPKSATGVPRSSKLTSQVRRVMHELHMNPKSLEEHIRAEQASIRAKMSPPEIEDLQGRLDRYQQNQDGRTLRALVKKAQEAKRSPDRRVSKKAHDVLRELRRNKG